MRTSTNGILLVARRIPTWASLLVITAAIATISCIGWLSYIRNTNEVPVIILNESALNVGEVWMQSAYNHTVSLTNASRETLLIRDIKGSCTCASIQPSSFSLPPGATQMVNVVLDLVPPRNVELDAKSIPFAVTLAAQIDKLARPITWEIVGQVKPTIVLNPDHIDFGRILPETSTATKSASVRCLAPVDSIDASIDLEGAYAQTRRVGANAFRIDVSLPFNIGPGRIDTILTIRGFVKGQELPKSHIPVWATVLDDIAIVPEEVCFGVLALGESCEEMIAIRSRTNSQFEILDAVADSPSIGVALQTQKGRREYIFGVAQAGIAAGPQSATVRFKCRLPNRVDKEVAIPVTYYGISHK